MNAGARMSMMVHSHTAVEFYSKVFGQPHVVTEVQSKAIGGTVVADLPCYDVVVCQGGTCPDEEFVECAAREPVAELGDYSVGLGLHAIYTPAGKAVHAQRGAAACCHLQSQVGHHGHIHQGIGLDSQQLCLSLSTEPSHHQYCNKYLFHWFCLCPKGAGFSLEGIVFLDCLVFLLFLYRLVFLYRLRFL